MTAGRAAHGRIAAILVAAGRSQRMDGVDKTLAPLHGRPLAAWALQAFAGCDLIDAIVLVAGERNRAALERLGREHGNGKLLAVVQGGASRRDSVANGLHALPPEFDLVAVHDAARPLVSRATIARGIELARAGGAAVATAPVTDTIKRVDAEGRVECTIDRDTLRAVQTPQVFQRALLERAHANAANAPNAANAAVTDDAMLVEALGEPVLTYPSDGPNLKVTTPQDLRLAEALLAARPAPEGAEQ